MSEVNQLVVICYFAIIAVGLVSRAMNEHANKF
jgi:hypothetical protein